jgi:hypothetical protein
MGIAFQLADVGRVADGAAHYVKRHLVAPRVGSPVSLRIESAVQPPARSGQ